MNRPRTFLSCQMTGDAHQEGGDHEYGTGQQDGHEVDRTSGHRPVTDELDLLDSGEPDKPFDDLAYPQTQRPCKKTEECSF